MLSVGCIFFVWCARVHRISFFFPLECSGYWHVRSGRHFPPMSSQCFLQVHSRSNWSEERSCSNPDLLTISSYSCAVPLSLLRCHVCNWSSTLSLHSESFINFAADSLQTDSPLVSNKHLNSMSATDKALSDENMKGSSEILSSRLCAIPTKLGWIGKIIRCFDRNRRQRNPTDKKAQFLNQ